MKGAVSLQNFGPSCQGFMQGILSRQQKRLLLFEEPFSSSILPPFFLLPMDEHLPPREISLEEARELAQSVDGEIAVDAVRKTVFTENGREFLRIGDRNILSRMREGTTSELFMRTQDGSNVGPLRRNPQFLEEWGQVWNRWGEIANDLRRRLDRLMKIIPIPSQKYNGVVNTEVIMRNFSLRLECDLYTQAIADRYPTESEGDLPAIKRTMNMLEDIQNRILALLSKLEGESLDPPSSSIT